MITHYLKVAFRNLVKYKTQTLISIIGLSVGFTCFALSVLWIRYEMAADLRRLPSVVLPAHHLPVPGIHPHLFPSFQ